MFETTTTSTLETELVTLAGHLAAGTCRFLQLLAEFDERRGWVGPGLRSCGHWLTWRVGLSLRTARDHLRVAHALRRLPLVTAAFAAGRVSYSKVRALTRIATPATEEGLLGIALQGTTSQLESLVQATRAACDPRPAAARRGLRWSRASDGSLLVSLRIPAERGEELMAAVEALVAERSGSAEPPGPAPDPGPERDELRDRAAEHSPGPVTDTRAAQRLDALLDLVAGGGPTRPTTLVVHLRADGDEQGRPRAWVDGGPVLSPTVAGRLTCTAAVQALLVDRRGNPLYLGRRRRTATPQQLLALRVRDGDRCVFPGCDATRHLQAHHIRWWRRGGPTDIDNLVLICSFHHTLVHDHGFGVTRAGDGLTFHRPGGTPVPAAGPPTGGRVDELVARHAARSIDGWTVTPRWGGEALDRDQALTWLLPELRREAA